MEWTLGKETELSVLSILRRRKYWEKYESIVQPGFFGDDETRHLFQLLQGYVHQYPQASKLSIHDWRLLVRRFTKDPERRAKCLALLKTILKMRNTEPKLIEETVVEFARRQLVKTAVLEGLNLLEQPELNLERLQDYLTQAEQIHTVVQAQFYDYFNSPTQRIAELANEERISSGIKPLDEAMSGGFGKGELAVFLGPPGRGKTLALVNMGYAALRRGLSVFHVTCEISDRKVARRYDCRITRRQFGEIREDPEELQRYLVRLRKRGGDLVIKDYSSKFVKVAEIRSSILAYSAKCGSPPALVIIDYADLLASSKGSRDHRFELEDIYYSLRRLAAELTVPIITASQSTRKSLAKITISIEDFAEAFAKAAIADVVIAICQTPEEKEDNLVRLHIAKSRQSSRNPTFRLAFDPDRMYLGHIEGLR